MIFLNPYSELDDISPKLANFLKFLTDGRPVDEYTERLVTAVEAARNNQMWEVEYKAYYANLQDRYNMGQAKGRAEGFAEGKAEGIVQTVKDMGGTIETAAQQLVKQCVMDMEKALETAKLYW